MISTKTGDEGRTTCGNQRVDKDDLLVEVIGEIDELQAVLQMVNFNKKIIDDLSGIMGDLGCNKKFSNSNFQFSIKKMEDEIKDFNLDKFLIFKTKKAKELNWVRTVCRRVERRVVSLSRKQKVSENILKYFNRLSDYLFIKACQQDKSSLGR